MDDGAIAEVHRYSLVLAANPDHLTFQAAILFEGSEHERCRTINTGEQENDRAVFTCYISLRIVLPQHFVQIVKGLHCVLWCSPDLHPMNALVDSWLRRLINLDNQYRRTGFYGLEVHARRFAEAFGKMFCRGRQSW